MTRSWLILAGAAILSLPAMAQEEGGPPAEGGRQGRGGFAQQASGAMVIRLADADKNGEVTAEEWTNYLTSVKSDVDGHSDVAKIKDTYTLSILDKDGDKLIKADDLNKILAAADKNGDKKIAGDELGRGGRAGAGGQGGGFNREEMLKKYDTDGDGQLSDEERRKMREEMGGAGGGGRRRQGGEGGEGDAGGQGGGEGGDQRRNRAQAMDGSAMIELAILRRADADKNNEVSAEEFAALIAKLGADEKGVITPKKAHDGLMAPPKVEEGAEERPRAGGGMGGLVLDRLLDADGDGRVPVENLNKLFASLDKNGDKSLQKDELQARPAPRGGEDRRRRDD